MTEANVQFETARPQRAFDVMITQVRDRLRSGDLRPGQKLPSEREFAEQLGLSRNTVREGLRMLEIAGLVTLRKGASGGAFVTDSTADAVTRGFIDGLTLTDFALSDLTESRIGLETFIVEKVCQRATDEELDELEASARTAAELDAQTRWPEKVKAHMRFHEELTAAAHNPILSVLISPLITMTSELVLRTGPSADDFIEASRARLLAALRKRDTRAATGELEWYLSRLNERWIEGGGHSPER